MDMEAAVIVCTLVPCLTIVLCAVAYNMIGERWATVALQSTLELNGLFQHGRFREAALLHGPRFVELEKLGPIQEIRFCAGGFSSALGWRRASANCIVRTASGSYEEELVWDVRQRSPKLTNFRITRRRDVPPPNFRPAAG
jgi:hypothetical protein